MIPYEQLDSPQANHGMANNTTSAKTDPSTQNSAVIRYEMLPVKKVVQPENV